MLAKANEILKQTSYSEKVQSQIQSQIKEVQDNPELINVNFKLIKISKFLYLQMKAELALIGRCSILFDLYFQNPIEFGLRCKILKPQDDETMFNTAYDTPLGFIDFTFFLEKSDKLSDALLKMKQKFKNEFPYINANQDLQNLMEQTTNKFKIQWNTLNSINQILIIDLIEGLKKKASINHLILDADVMLNELQQEKNKLIKFQNENKDKEVDESNLEKIISITLPYQQQLVEIEAQIKGIRDTLRLLQFNFQKGRASYTELCSFTKSLAEEEFEAVILLKKCQIQ